MKNYTNIIAPSIAFLIAIAAASFTTREKTLKSDILMTAYLHLPTPADCQQVSVNCSLIPGPVCMSGSYQAYGKNNLGIDCNLIIYKSD